MTVTAAHPVEPGIRHVPALDGLRAVAVSLVLAYHAGASWIGGGFLGVSVFFTLSGFLITSLLVNEWTETGRIDLRRFWPRRFRRLLPASWLTIAAVVVLSGLGAWDTEQLRALRGDVPWSLAELVNWHFIATGAAYGAELSAPSPLQHYWSLAVEQQFYVVLPVVVLGVLALARRRGARHPLRWLLGAFVVLAIASAAANGWLARSNADRAYFGTDTRAAELLIGAALAVVIGRRSSSTPGADDVRRRRLIGAFGLGGVGALVVLSMTASVPDRWLYPWGLLGCAVATVAVIVAAREQTLVAHVLSWRPFPAIGRISYGVYLVHWPVYLALTPDRLGFDGVGVHVARVALTLGIAALSYRFIEHPIRVGARLPTKQALIALPLAGVALVVGGLLTTSGLPPVAEFLQPRATTDLRVIEPDDRAAGSTQTSAPMSSPSTAAPAPVPSSEPPVTATSLPPQPPRRVLIVGDSIADSLDDELGRTLAAFGVRFASATAPGCGVVTGFPTDEQGRVAEMTRPCDAAIPERQLDAVRRFDPDLVVVMSSWELTNREVDGRWYQQGTPEADGMLRVLYAQTLDRLSSGGAVVALTLLPDMVDGRTQQVRPEELERSRRLNDTLSSIAAERVGVITSGLDAIVCPGAPCPTVVDGIELRAGDGRHFAARDAARWVAQRWAAEILQLDLRQT